MKLVIVRMVLASVGTVVIVVVNAVEVDITFNVASRPRLNKSKNWRPIWRNSNSRCRLSKNT
jgi:murein tripeptide amidase MpaA